MKDVNGALLSAEELLWFVSKIEKELEGMDCLLIVPWGLASKFEFGFCWFVFLIDGSCQVQILASQSDLFQHGE
jgi:hypothetical protein